MLVLLSFYIGLAIFLDSWLERQGQPSAPSKPSIVEDTQLDVSDSLLVG